MLRGASVSSASKWTAEHFPPYDADDLTRVRDEMGFDAIRLLVFWQAIEPYPGVYDEAYLDSVRAFVEMAGGLGLHVIVDMHQDLYGAGFGQAGAPRWACDESLYATFRAPKPWMLGYAEPEVSACFDRLYGDGDTRAAFAAAWAKLANHLRGTDGLFAYELINEPFWGSTTASDFERKVAPDFYHYLIDVIRGVDPSTHIAVEPAPSASVGVPTDLPKLRRERLVYAPHFYPPAVEAGKGTRAHPTAWGNSSTWRVPTRSGSICRW